MQQTSKDQFWKDEAGLQIPYTRITGSERLREKQAFKLLSEAQRISKTLMEFKELISKVSQEVLARTIEEMKGDVKTRKGNFTWYNFDRSIKIEVNINESIAFDETLITLCKEKLDEFISDNLSGVDAFVKELVNDAFQNSKGGLDAKKVMSLLKHRSKIKDHRYHEAMNMLEKSIRRPDSKTYYRVWTKNKDGGYDAINLNFSNI
jgi:hypothetical protein